MFETLPSKLLQQGCCLLGCVGSWHQVTFIFLALRWGILVVTNSKMLQKCKKLRILCWRCTFTSKTMWQMPEPSWRSCRNICHCSPFSLGKLLQIKIWWKSKYTLHILTFWKTIIQKHHSTNNIKMYSFLLLLPSLWGSYILFSYFFISTPHPMFFSQSERSSFTVLEWWYIYSCAYCNIWLLGYLSWYGDLQWAERSRDWIPVAEILCAIQTNPKSNPDSCTMVTGSLLEVKLLEHGAGHSPPSSAGLQIGLSYTFASTLFLHRSIMGWLLPLFCNFYISGMHTAKQNILN